MKGREQRRLKRRKLIYYLRVEDLSAGRPLGRLVDITTEGFMLVSSQAIPAGKEYRLALVLPPNPDAPGRIEFSARSLWSGKDVNPEFHDTGFAFTPGGVRGREHDSGPDCGIRAAGLRPRRALQKTKV